MKILAWIYFIIFGIVVAFEIKIISETYFSYPLNIINTYIPISIEISIYFLLGLTKYVKWKSNKIQQKMEKYLT